ncbi:hypothetical protein HYE82_07430 [Streptomyces sp. BR123]|jgi:hypothetical protein|uniref:hypothetical protein n=1 Tax=Streptomyces sp. BR123 TaxID=2749828 RepID=UPI0015C48114|nr:hypothetical protein [Streptomyces sp. BR123]NXY94220.1 hypothetical protein [Streptomyces sp. BR123]
MRTSAKRAFTAVATGAAVIMMAAAGASAAPASGAASAAGTPAPAGAPRWEFIGEFPKAQCIELRDAYAGKAKCVKNAGGLYDLLVWV